MKCSSVSRRLGQEMGKKILGGSRADREDEAPDPDGRLYSAGDQRDQKWTGWK